MKKFVKILASFVLIVLVILPMFLYLNPFAWGMRPSREYYSEKTQLLITDLNTKYHLDMNINVELLDTLWYFRDVKYHRISKLKNIEFRLINKTNKELTSLEVMYKLKPRNEDKQEEIDTTKVRKYIQKFNDKFEHRMYFDSVKVKSKDKDNVVIYKTKINE